MRKIRVPHAKGSASLALQGPVDPAAPDAAAGEAALRRALLELRQLDLQRSSDGWCVAWSSPVMRSGPLVKCWLWVRRSEGAEALRDALAEQMEAARFLVRRHVTSAMPQHPRVIYVRSGRGALGLEGSPPCFLDQVEVIEDDRAEVDLVRRFHFKRQRCPRCGAVDPPLELIQGFPTPAAQLAVALGEAAFGGCAADPHVRANALCRHCGAEFQAR